MPQVLSQLPAFWTLILYLLVAFLVFSFFASFRRIGPSEVGPVTKRYSAKKLAKDNPIACEGEAG